MDDETVEFWILAIGCAGIPPITRIFHTEPDREELIRAIR